VKISRSPYWDKLQTADWRGHEANVVLLDERTKDCYQLM